MCSKEKDCDCTQAEASRLTRTQRQAVCVKCAGANGPPAVLVRIDDPALCRHCFLAACLHKFKSSFGKSQLIPNGATVAVGFSGGLNSTVLLDLLYQHSKRRFVPIIFHILDPHLPVIDRDRITAVLEKYGFKYRLLEPHEVNLRVSHLQNALHEHSSVPQELKPISNLTKWCQQRMLVDCARLLGCQWLLLGHNGTQLSSEFLLEVIEGRGGFGTLSAAFADRRYDDVTIVRPLNEFMAKELVFYARFNRLEHRSPPVQPVTQTVLERPNWTTLPRLCEHFVVGLQATGFPSTTKAILGTASKLVSPMDSNSIDSRCRLCMAPITSPPVDSPLDSNKLALAALEFSRSLVRPAGQPSVTEKLPTAQLCLACLTVYEELPNPLKPVFDQAFLDGKESSPSLPVST